jgi:hypothetical protein
MRLEPRNIPIVLQSTGPTAPRDFSSAQLTVGPRLVLDGTRRLHWSKTLPSICTAVVLSSIVGHRTLFENIDTKSIREQILIFPSMCQWLVGSERGSRCSREPNRISQLNGARLLL